MIQPFFSFLLLSFSLMQITVKYDYRTVNQLVEVQSVRSGPLSQPARGFISSSPTQSSLVIYLKSIFTS